jgi:mannose-6-phosphate isomerase-like protein (cupin superfamily)
MDIASDVAVRRMLGALRGALNGHGGTEPVARLVSALDRLGAAFRPVAPVRSASCDWLDAALAAAPPETEGLRDALAPVAAMAEWREGPRPGAPEGFDGGYAYVALVGPDGQIPSSECRLGLYLQQPGLHYPPHAHDAEELYFIVSGTADWQAGDRRFKAAPGQLIHHASAEPHVMATGETPLLAIFVWLGDIEGRYWFL